MNIVIFILSVLAAAMLIAIVLMAFALREIAGYLEGIMGYKASSPVYEDKQE